MDIKAALADNARAVNAVLDDLLPVRDEPEARLMEAMRYSALSSGKRIRPFLVVSSAGLFNVSAPFALRVAAAVEMVHCYSLIHDDLPAMDNDELRRGLPTCHIRYDEATAILAGDALLTRAFEVLADAETHTDPRVRGELVQRLARAAGAEGMVGGQMLDLLADSFGLEVEEVTRLQRMKTGELIAFACDAGAVLGKAADSARQSLHAYAHDLGLAFQIADDLLDVEGEEAEMGKKSRKDNSAGKATFVTLLGVERARAQSHILAEQAINHLEVFAESAQPLRSLARYAVERTH
ncbi:MAG: polyprenyl synthetase family protein [Rhodospirillales bacterium]|nr:polyprenyl synthetase family protein [Rhodospirillales bacterium]